MSARAARGAARSFVVPDGGWPISTAASLHRSRPRFHLVLLAYCTQTGRHHTIRAASPTIIAALHSNPPPTASHPRDLPGWGHVRGHILLRPSRRNSLSRTMQLDGARRPACIARQRKRVQELAAASRAAAHYDGIFLARWRRISVARAR